jgi:hypothetical protein
VLLVSGAFSRFLIRVVMYVNHVGYSLRLGNRAATAGLGYWMELLGIGDQLLRRQLEQPTD